MMKKRFLCVLLTLVMLFSLLPAPAAAADTEGALWVRKASWNSSSGTYYDNPNNGMFPLSDLYISPGDLIRVYLYYGTSEADAVLLPGGTLTSGNLDLLRIAPATDGGTYFALSANAFGPAEVTYTSADGTQVYTSTVTVDIPSGAAFYTQPVRSQDTFTIHPQYNPETGTTLWIMSSAGLKASYVNNLSVTIGGISYPGVTATGVARTASSKYDIRVDLPPGLSIGQNQTLDVCNRYNSYVDHWYAMISQPESPRLLYRPCNWNDNGCFEDTSFMPVTFDQDSLRLVVGSSLSLYLYWGISNNNSLIQELSVVSGNSISVLKYIDQDEKVYWMLRPVAIGTTVLSADGHEVTLSVSLPVHGLYTAQSRDADHLCPSGGDGVSYYELEDHALWLMCEGGYTAEELDSTTVAANNQPIETERVLREGSSDRYDLKIKVAKPEQGNYEISVTHSQQGRIAYCWISSRVDHKPSAAVGDYAVGFVWENPTIIDMINSRQGGYRSTTDKLPLEDNGYLPSASYSFQIKAGQTKTDAQGSVYYEPVSEKDVSFRVKRTWFEVASGNENALSWTAGTPTSKEKTDYPEDTSRLTVYYKEGYMVEAIVFAELEVTTGKEKHTVTISVSYRVDRPNQDASVTRPADDTVEKLNADLAELMAQDLTGINGIDVYLADTTYEGIIQLPAKWGLRFHGGTSTTIKGGISLNGSYLPACDNIHFIAPESDEVTRAIWGGPSNPRNCTFYGYDIALDSNDHGLVTPAYGNVFVNNDIAIRVNVIDYATSKWDTQWRNNTFIKNGIAVQILSLDQTISSYYLRISDSNFIGNTTDFDLHAPGTLYWQKNYFGKVHPKAEDMAIGAYLEALLGAKTDKAVHQLVTSNSPNITKANGVKSKVITNPRWKYPTKDWWLYSRPDWWQSTLAGSNGMSSAQLSALPSSTEEDLPYTNILVADWALDTQIINEEASDLMLDGTSFISDSDMLITVIKGQDQSLLGHWTVSPAEGMATQSQTSSSGFNAGITVEDGGNHQLLVTVADSLLYAQQQVTLSIPTPLASLLPKVTLDGAAVPASTNGSEITFTVTAGGTYTVTFSAAAGGSSPDVQRPGNAAYTGDLVIGFAREMADGDVLLISEGNSFYNRGTGQPNPDSAYLSCWDFLIAAGVKTTDETNGTVYEKDQAVTDSLVIHEIRLELVSGDPGTYSWTAGTEQTLVRSDVSGNTFHVYAKDGYAAEAMVYADISYTVNGTEHTATVSTSISLMRGGVVFERISSDIDTIEELEALLAEHAAAANPYVVMVYHFYLPGVTYEGTLTLPEQFPELSRIHLYGATDPGPDGTPLKTLFHGGIDLNGNFLEQMKDIHFRAADSGAEEQKGLYNGGVLQLSNCTFSGYDVAVDSKDELQINLTSGNVFVDNGIALRVDVAGSTSDYRQSWSGNTFIGNGTALQVLSLNAVTSPYYFRVLDSNFIGNTTDLDIRHPGTFYLYRNYYGKIHPQAENMAMDELLQALLDAETEQALNQLVTSNSPNIAKAKGVKNKIVTNPRSKYPIRGWWVSQVPVADLFSAPSAALSTLSTEATPYTNILVADWALGAQVLNEEAAALKLDNSAFSAQSDMRITVVEGETETLLGIWTVTAEGTVAAPGQATFDSALQIFTFPNGRIRVTVKDNALLSQRRVTLSVPCSAPFASVMAPDGTIQNGANSGGMITFTVSAGGNYMIDPREDSASFFSVFEPQSVSGENGTDITFAISAEAPLQATLALAAYRDGQLVEVTMVPVSFTAGANTVTARLDTAVSDELTYQAYLLGGDFLPLTEQLAFTAADVSQI